MRSRIPIALLLAAFVVSCSDDNPTDPAEDTENPSLLQMHKDGDRGRWFCSVHAAVEEVFGQYASSIESADVDTWMSLWTDDGIAMWPDYPPLVGKEEIRPALEAALAVVDYSDMDINVEEVRRFGRLAFARGTFTATYTWGDATIFFDGKYMTIFKSQRGWCGPWKIHRDVYNSNVP
jgi:ketosteroid isomerase-like protein